MITCEVDPQSPSITAVRFSNGVLNKPCVEVSSYVKKTDNDELEDSDGEQQIVTTSIDGITYVGQNSGPSNRFPTDACDYYMGIHDKSTGKMRIVSASLIQMEPWFKEEEDVGNFQSKTMREKNDALASEFGSGRSQRAVNKRLQEQLDDKMITSTAMNMVENAPAPQENDQVMTQSTSIPPYNLEATTPDDVYKLKDLVSRDVLNSLSENAATFTNSTQEDLHTWRDEKKYFSFVLSKLENMPDHPDARKLQGQCLMYLQYLMNLYLMKVHDLRGKDPLPQEWPRPVKDHMLKLFTLEVTEPGRSKRRCVPSRLKDLLMSHILVICLKMSEFALDLSLLRDDLKHSFKKLSVHANYLGCSTKKSKQGIEETYIATLKVPLTFPIVRDKAPKNKLP